MLRTRVSEKVIRRIMAEDGLVAHVPRRRRYSSYEGETTPAPGNLVNRDFTAEAPNGKWLTDITEIKAWDGKVYLSPMIDCHDGKIVAYTAGFSPNAGSPTGCSSRPWRRCRRERGPWCIPDRGCHYRWPGWLELMERYGLTRSMSAKGCSPDNAAAEGFFGRLKQEFFHKRSFRGVTIDEFTAMLDEYMVWYRDKRIKTEYGMSIMDKRIQLGLVA